MGDFDYDEKSYVHEVEKSIDFIGQDLDFFTEVKARLLAEIARRRLGDPGQLRVLDVGSGVGLLDAEIANDFGSVFGIDPSSAELEAASVRNPDAHYVAADGNKLPFASGVFDVVVAVCVVHHVPVDKWQVFTGELARIARPGGLVVIMEHNPINPLTRLAVSRCSFDEDAVLLSKRKVRKLMVEAGLAKGESRYILFFPWRTNVFRRIESGLRALPLGAQHVTVGIKG